MRNEASREEYLNAVTDIRLYEEDGKQYYFVGIVGNGMKPGIERTAKIYEIEAKKGSSLFFERMLPLMDVLFVRNSQLTVVPFPFKYLREAVV